MNKKSPIEKIMDIHSIQMAIIGGVQFILDSDLDDREKIEKIRAVMVQYVNSMTRPHCAICGTAVPAVDEAIKDGDPVHRECLGMRPLGTVTICEECRKPIGDWCLTCRKYEGHVV